MRDVRVLDRVTRVAPLGLRFLDAATGAIVGDGLIVTVYPSTRPSQRVQAFPNRAGVYVPQSLPGLRALEHGTGDAAYWSTLPTPRTTFVVEVLDEQGRFQPFTFTAVPPERGLFSPTAGPPGSPIDAATGIPLFSTPSRPVPAGMAVVRSDLSECRPGGQPRRPAAWAVLEVSVDVTSPGQPAVRARGVADDRGRVAVIFPYPVPAAGPLGSPLGSPVEPPRGPLARQRWRVTLNAAYQAVAQAPLLPELGDLLAAMPLEGHLFEDAACTRPLQTRELKFGEELVVSSNDETDGRAPSVLFVTAGGSPP